LLENSTNFRFLGSKPLPDNDPQKFLKTHLFQLKFTYFVYMQIRSSWTWWFTSRRRRRMTWWRHHYLLLMLLFLILLFWYRFLFYCCLFLKRFCQFFFFVFFIIVNIVDFFIPSEICFDTIAMYIYRLLRFDARNVWSMTTFFILRKTEKKENKDKNFLLKWIA
jgi:hypothetical protein